MQPQAIFRSLASEGVEYFLVGGLAATRPEGIHPPPSLTRQRAGKAVVTVPEGSKVLVPLRVQNPQNDLLAAVTDAGRLLIFPMKDML